MLEKVCTRILGVSRAMLKGLFKMELMVVGEGLDLVGFGRGGGAGGFLLTTAGLPGSGQVHSMESFSASPAVLQVH